jgi:hypothetical protein
LTNYTGTSTLHNHHTYHILLLSYSSNTSISLSLSPISHANNHRINQTMSLPVALNSAENNSTVTATIPDTGRWLIYHDKIDKSECYARNESAQFPMTNLFIGDSTLGCKSDADEQLIIHVAFTEFVKVRTRVSESVKAVSGRLCLTANAKKSDIVIII